MDANNYVAANGDGFDVVVNGRVVGHYPSQAAAESAFNTARAGSSTPTTPSATPTGVAGDVGGMADVMKLQLAAAQANQAAQIAYNNAALELQRQNAGHQWGFQQEQLAQAAAHDAWQKSVAQSGVDVNKLLAHIQEGSLTGTYDGSPTLARQEASGYLTPQTGAVGDLVAQGWRNAVANGNATPQAARDIWMHAMPGMTPQAADAMGAWGHEFSAQFGRPPTNAEIDQRLKSMGLNPETPTLAREHEQNQTGLGLLNLASQLRGPDNAFAYANTLNAVPESMRASLNQMMQRSGISYGGPSSSGLGGVVGQISAGNINGAQAAPAAAPGMAMAEPMRTTMGASLPAYQGPAMGAAPSGPGAVMQGASMQPAPQTHVHVYGAQQAPTTIGQGPQQAQAGQPAHLSSYSPTDWNNTNSYVKRLMLAGQEAMGRDKDAELDQYKMTLPRYNGPQGGRIAA